MKLGNIETSTDTPLGNVSLGDPVGSLSKIMVGGVMLGAGLTLSGIVITNGKSFIESTFGVDTGEGYINEV